MFAENKFKLERATFLRYRLCAKSNRTGSYRFGPLGMGLPCGQLVLSAAVLAILITAPPGAIGIDLTYNKLLVRENLERRQNGMNFINRIKKRMPASDKYVRS